MSVQQRNASRRTYTHTSASLLEEVTAGDSLHLELSFRFGSTQTVTGTVATVSTVEIETSHLVGRSVTIFVDSTSDSGLDQVELNFLTDPNAAFFTPTDAYLLAEDGFHWSRQKIESVTASRQSTVSKR